MPSEPTIFERIVARELPADIVFEDDRLMAITDIAPKAPMHLLVFPKQATYRDVGELSAADPQLLADIVGTARMLAEQRSDGQYRLIFNTGEDAGQTIFHVHAHVLAGGLTEGSLGF
ncbi:MAG TPA: histidine triad nucleotide-binding protein [Pseudolysinimonas sp.]|jgi:histidine triad (HIT) family protein|nr:histidine triad nucleotide-binding protein [Pseudolysinimonas sp.]